MMLIKFGGQFIDPLHITSICITPVSAYLSVGVRVTITTLFGKEIEVDKTFGTVKVKEIKGQDYEDAYEAAMDEALSKSKAWASTYDSSADFSKFLNAVNEAKSQHGGLRIYNVERGEATQLY